MNSDKELAPLTPAIVRALNDKLYEKRKVAALEIEKLVRDYVQQNNTAQIKHIIAILSQEFALSLHPHSRKGGLIGLAACAIALGKDYGVYLKELMEPVLTCFNDPDSRLRYYACEALYNIVKVARGSVLPHFCELFDGLSKLAADPDPNVKSGSELLDRLLKDIVTESSKFDLVAFVPLLRERIYTQNQYGRQFIISWIAVLESVPDIKLLGFLPEILDGLFEILGDQSKEIRRMCECVLAEFLKEIKKNPANVKYSNMANIVLVHCQASDELTQLTAMTWIREFVQLAGRLMLPFAAGVLNAVLPCLGNDDPKRKNIKEAASACNLSLMRLVLPEDDLDAVPPSPMSPSLAAQAGTGDVLQPRPEASLEESQDSAPEASTEVDMESLAVRLDLDSIVNVLAHHLTHDSMLTRIAVLKWIYSLYTKTPRKMFRHTDRLFPVLLKTLSDDSDEVILKDLEVLAEIASSPAGQLAEALSGDSGGGGGGGGSAISGTAPGLHAPPPLSTSPGSSAGSAAWKATDRSPLSPSMNSYFHRFMVKLLQCFGTEPRLLEHRGAFIIRQLCLLLNAENIFHAMAEILLAEGDLRFASTMVQTLNSILLTSTELFELRTQLKDLHTAESRALFCSLYRSWCHNPVATVSLCFLTQNYKHAYHLIQKFAGLEVTVDFLTEVDKLVQLIESPIFTYLRLQLLDVESHPYLIKALYGLLMLLPQSSAFTLLRQRLACVPDPQLMVAERREGMDAQKNSTEHQELLRNFEQMQVRHQQAKRQRQGPEQRFA